jgi:hypothetical protein
MTKTTTTYRTTAILPPDNWRDLLYHPLSTLVEFGAGISLDALAAHMRSNGFDPDEPITRYEGKILDGRHCHHAAILADVVPSFQDLIGDPLPFLWKKVHRQHLSEAQRALFAAGLAKLPRGGDGRNQHGRVPPTDGTLPMTQGEAAETMNVSETAVGRAKVILDKGSPKLKKAVSDGTVSLSDGAKLAAEAAPKLQDRAVDKVAKGKAKTAAEVVNVMCERCKRIGSRGRDCARCQDLEDQAAVKDCGKQAELHKEDRYEPPGREPGDDTEAIEAEKRAERQAKNGRMAYDWSGLDEAWGKLLREIDKLGKCYRAKETPRAEGFRRLLVEWKANFREWYRELAKQNPPEE